MNNNKKNIPGGSPKQKTPSLGVFVELAPNYKNDYRSVISITFISDILFHIVFHIVFYIYYFCMREQRQ